MSDFSEDFFSFLSHQQKPQKDYQILPKASKIITKTTKDIVDMPEYGSQNFCLQLSSDSLIEDSIDIPNDKREKKADKDDVIVISDSSSDCSDHEGKRKGFTPIISENKHESLVRSKQYTMEISDDSDEDEKFYQAWKSRNKYISKFSDADKAGLKDNSVYTSDDSNGSSSLLSSDYNKNTNIPKGTHVRSLLPSVRLDKNEKYELKIRNNVLEQKRNICTPSKNIPLSGKSNCDNASNNNSSGTKSKKPQTYVQLTRGDINKILKNIQSTKGVYESPKMKELNDTIVDESIDEECQHPAFLQNENEVATVINETPSNTDILENQSSQVNILTSTGVYNKPDDASIDNQMTNLSERKKKEISRWLMTNSPGSASDSSFTNIAASNRNSISSGNSSLERFEMNYETPNNRGRIMKSKVNKKNTPPLNINSKSSNIVSKQKTNEFLDKVNNSNPRSCNNIQKKKSTDQFKNVVTEQPGDLNLVGCADILDKLYGNIWRDKANVLLSTPTEKQNVITKDRAVQTERKDTTKSKYLTKKGELQIKHNTDTKSQAKSTSKKLTTYRIQRNSFINDISSSDSDIDSLYYTALTTPKTSNIKPRQPTSSSLQKVLEICDPESEDDEYNSNHQPEIRRVIDRKKLSFSDDESSSNTSEFDPGDDIPEKRTDKKDINRIKKILVTPKNKYPFTPVQNQEKDKHKSFLASLSDSVPMNIAHPDAKKYRLMYKSNKEDLCKYLYKLYNEKVFDNKLPADMLIEWNIRMRGTAGYCYNKKSIVHLKNVCRSSRIVLATKILDTPDRLRDTLIHEMCHAASWLINEVSDGHGPFWTEWAKKAMKIFPELPPIRRCHDYKIKTKFTYRCIGCGYSIGRHSKSLDIEKKRCGHCYGKFELLINKTTKSGIVQTPTQKRELSAFALYVKENYNSVKKDQNLKHAEVMKLLGQQFSAIKIGKKDDNNIDNKRVPTD